MFRLLKDQLKAWKDDPFRLPLLLRGARQVGKSYLVETFGQEYFESLVVVNFDSNPEFSACFETLEPEQIIQKIELITNQVVTPGKTLLFFDEIQNCPKAIMALRYFKEKSPLLHVIGAGSLLEFVLEDEEFSFPVGRVQFIYVRPLSFKEFLIASNTLHLPNILDNASLKTPLDRIVHEQFIKYVKQYFLVGGMPAVIAAFLRTKSFLKSKEMQAIILQTYQNDFGKYAKKNLFKYLELLFEKVPNLIGEQFKYSKIDPEPHTRELKKAIRLLNRAGIIHTVHATSGSGIPLKFHRNEQKFKLLFLDIGLIQQVNQIDPEQIWSEDLTVINAGMLAEQFVGQELLNISEFYEEKELFFWERMKAGSDAEVDYVISYKSHIIPIEVKAGKTGRLRSIKIFMQEKKSPLGIRISQKPLSYEDHILSVPFYLIQQIPKLIEEVLFPKQ